MPLAGTKTKRKPKRAARKKTKSAGRKSVAKKKVRKNSRKRTSSYSGGRAQRKRYPSGKRRNLTWVEAARSSGAVYTPNSLMTKKDGRGRLKFVPVTKSKVGKPMSKQDALAAKRPVVGFLPKWLIDFWYDSGAADMKTARQQKTKKYKDAVQYFNAAQKALAEQRKKRGTTWKRATQYKTKGRGKNKKKVRIPDFEILDDGSVKFRSGRGPKTSITLFRGFAPSEVQQRHLIEGGFAGKAGPGGGRVKLNRKRKRRAKVRKNPARKKKAVRKNKPRRGKKKAKSRKKKTRRRAVLNNRPKRKRRRKTTKRKAARRKSTKRRRKNPSRSRKRRVRKNPARKSHSRKRRRRKSSALSRVRKNPMSATKKNPMGALKQYLDKLQTASPYVTGAHLVIGMGVSGLFCGGLRQVPVVGRIFSLRGRYLGAAGRFAGCLGAASLAGLTGTLLERTLGRNVKFLQNAGGNFFVAGVALAVGNLLLELIPGASSILPGISNPRGMRAMRMPMHSMASEEGMGNYGSSVLSPEDLVAGESSARLTNEFHGMSDFLELSGMGSSGGQPIPIEDLRGYPGWYGGGNSISGMGDYLELNPTAPLVTDGFNPGTENF